MEVVCGERLDGKPGLIKDLANFLGYNNMLAGLNVLKKGDKLTERTLLKINEVLKGDMYQYKVRAI